MQTLMIKGKLGILVTPCNIVCAIIHHKTQYVFLNFFLNNQNTVIESPNIDTSVSIASKQRHIYFKTIQQLSTMQKGKKLKSKKVVAGREMDFLRK